MTDIFVPENPPLMDTADGERMAEYLNRQMWAIATFLKSTRSGHGALKLSAATAVTQQITATPQKITNFDEKLPGDEGAFADVANNNIIIQETGLWCVSAQLVMKVLGSTANTTREVLLQFYNDTDSAVLDIVGAANIPRYGESLSLSSTIIINATTQLIDKAYSLYIYSPSGDTIDVTNISVLDYFIYRVSGYTYTGV